MPSYTGPNGINFATALDYQVRRFLDAFISDIPVPYSMVDQNPYVLENFEFWPSWSHQNDQSDGAGGLSFHSGPVSWEPSFYDDCGGGSSIYKITGIAKDAAGLPKGNCRALLRRSYDDYLVMQTITDGDGIYGFQVPNNTTLYYIEVFQESPPLAGISVRTLTGE
jgi:hypothetical protein